jgi:hypothetical protein
MGRLYARKGGKQAEDKKERNNIFWCPKKFNLREWEKSLCFNWAPRHEGVLGSGSTALRILDLGTRWRWVVSFTPRPLYPHGKRQCYPLNRRLAGFQSRSGRGSEERNSKLLPGLEPSIIQPVAQCYTSELTWLPLNEWESKIYTVVDKIICNRIFM